MSAARAKADEGGGVGPPRGATVLMLVIGALAAALVVGVAVTVPVGGPTAGGGKDGPAGRRNTADKSKSKQKRGGTDRRAKPLYMEAGWRPRGDVGPWECIVIHHSATNTGGAKRFDTGHRAKGWQGLGYHFVIGNGSDTGDGVVEIGPRWKKQMHGAHCDTRAGYYNRHGIGICLVGDFDRRRPGPKQMQSLARLVRFLCAEYDIPPSRVFTHGGVDHETRCPGKHFDLKAFRALLKE